jgi:hypothetical protein
MTFSQEDFFYAFKRLPRVMREFLLSPEYETLIRSLGNKYGLHVDVTGQLSLITGYMLSGLISPLQLQQELQSLGIPNAASASIINDLNEQVFKPLQVKVRNAPPEEPNEEEGAVPAPETSTSTPAPVLVPAAPTYVPMQRAPQPPLVPAPAITMPVAPRPAPAPIREPSVFPPPITAAPVQPPPTPVSIPAPQPIPIYSQPVQPAPAYQTPVAPPPAPAPRPAAPPPANLPGANGPVPEWSGFSPMPAPVPPSVLPTPAPTPASSAPHEVMKSYGVDPYREAIE